MRDMRLKAALEPPRIVLSVSTQALLQPATRGSLKALPTMLRQMDGTWMFR